MATPSLSCDSIFIGGSLLTVTGGGLFVDNVSQTGAAAQQSTSILSGNLTATGISLLNTMSSDLVALEGAQTINGAKTFTNATKFDSSLSSTSLTNSLNFTSATLFDASSLRSILWNQRLLTNSAEETTLKWNLRQISGNWSTNTVPTESGHLINRNYLDVQTGILSDKINVFSGDAYGRLNTGVVNIIGSQSVLGHKTFIGGATVAGSGTSQIFRIVGSGAQNYLLANSFGFKLYNKTGSESIDVEGRTLSPLGGGYSVDYSLLRLSGNWSTNTLPNESGHLVNKGFWDSGNLVGKTLFVDSVYGNNSTALRERRDKPFLTISGARTASLTGDLITVLPGIYNEANILKNGVNLFLNPGANIIYTGSAEKGIITDESGPIQAFVHGGGIISRPLTTAADMHTVYIINSGSDISINCWQLLNGKSNTSSSNNAAIWHENGKLNINSDYIMATGNGAVGYYWGNGDGNINAKLILTTGGSTSFDAAIYMMGVAGSPSGNMNVTAETIQANYAAIANLNSHPLIAGWISAKRIKSTHPSDGFAITQQAGSKLYVEAQKIFGSISSSDGILYVNSMKAEETDGFHSLVQIDGGVNYINIDELKEKNSSLVEKIRITAGTGYVTTKTCFSSSANGVLVTDGKLELIGGKFYTSGISNKNPIVKNGGTLILKGGCELISHSSAYSISGLTSQDVRIYPGSCANTSVHSNITQQVSTLTVDANIV